MSVVNIVARRRRQAIHPVLPCVPVKVWHMYDDHIHIQKEDAPIDSAYS